MTVTEIRSAGRADGSAVTEEFVAVVAKLRAVVSAGPVDVMAEEINLLLHDHDCTGFTPADVKAALTTLALRGDVAWGRPQD